MFGSDQQLSLCPGDGAGLFSQEPGARIEKVNAEYDEAGEEITPPSWPVNYSGIIFASEAAYLGQASPVGGFNFRFSMNNNTGATQHNLIKQSYLDLKTQAGFEASEDC